MIKHKAGVLIRKIENSKIYVLLLHLIAHDYWLVPKGHMEDGETMEEAAVREVTEETGYKVKLIRRLPQVKYLDDERNNVVLNIFLGEIVGGTIKPENDNYELKWVLLEDAGKYFTYQSMKDFIKQAKNDIRLA